MSFFSDLLSGVGDFVGGVANFLGSNSTGANLAKTALLGLALNKTSKTKTYNQGNEVLQRQEVNQFRGTVNQGVRVQVDPDPTAKIPVIYGRATVGGIISDARISSDNRTMYYCLVLSEKTGTVFSTSADTVYTFNDIFANDQRIIFKTDGFTADYSIDRDGNIDYGVQNNVAVYLYAGDSETPQTPEYYSNGSLPNAYDVMPGWTTNHMMSDCIFAIVKINYNNAANLVRLPDMRFGVTTTLTRPGDVLYDYMTNTRYGCAIDAGDILTA